MFSFRKRATDFDLKDPALLDLLDQHHEQLRFAKFSPEIAFNLGLALREAFAETYGDEANGRSAKPGVKAGLGVVIAVRTFNGHDLFSCVAGAPNATGPDNWAWAGRKEKLVKATGKSSFLFGRVLAVQGRQPEDKGFPFPEYACHGGGFPIWLKNNTACPIGTILVSGLPQAEDHQLIVDVLEKFLPTLE